MGWLDLHRLGCCIDLSIICMEWADYMCIEWVDLLNVQTRCISFTRCIENYECKKSENKMQWCKLSTILRMPLHQRFKSQLQWSHQMLHKWRKSTYLFNFNSQKPETCSPNGTNRRQHQRRLKRPLSEPGNILKKFYALYDYKWCYYMMKVS